MWDKPYKKCQNTTCGCWYPREWTRCPLCKRQWVDWIEEHCKLKHKKTDIEHSSALARE